MPFADFVHKRQKFDKVVPRRLKVGQKVGQAILLYPLMVRRFVPLSHDFVIFTFFTVFTEKWVSKCSIVAAIIRQSQADNSCSLNGTATVSPAFM